MVESFGVVSHFYLLGDSLRPFMDAGAQPRHIPYDLVMGNRTSAIALQSYLLDNADRVTIKPGGDATLLPMG